MATYCISDIHGCYDEFMALLEKINFDPTVDAIYILGDVIDRGPDPLKCLQFVKKTNKIHLITGNHEQMMLDYYDQTETWNWRSNGGGRMRALLNNFRLSGYETEADALLSYVRSRPYFKTLKVGETRYFLSHAGLSPTIPFSRQCPGDLLWSRAEFYEELSLKTHTCIFGHTPTPYLHNDRSNFDVWFDPRNKDKIGIDGGCVFGGRLNALRLDDHAVFYVALSTNY